MRRTKRIRLAISRPPAAAPGSNLTALIRRRSICTSGWCHACVPPARVLISQDAGWYAVGEPRGGGKPRSYETMFTHFLPALRAKGFGTAEIETLLVRNPARAFAVAVRRAS